VWQLAILLAVLFFMADHQLRSVGTWSGDRNEAENAEHFEDSAQGGNPLRQAAFLSLAAAGLALLFHRRGKPWNPNWLLVSFMGAATLVMLLSIIWSVNPAQTARRVGVVLCCMLVAAGLARNLSPRELCLLVVGTLLPLVGFSFLLDVAAGSHPWSGTARFGGTLHPNETAVYCAMLGLAALVLARDSRSKYRLLWWTLLAVSLILLWLTKSRTTLAALALTLAVGWWVSLSRPLRRCSAAGILLLGGLALLLVGAVGDAVSDPVVDAVLIGRHEKAASLSGRIPLWEMLLEYADDRPLLGFGFSSFWTSSRIEEVYQAQHWAITSAHSVYLELMLGIGLVGTVLVLAAVLAATVAALRRYAQTADMGYVFIFLVLVFGLANGLLESIFAKPRCATILTFCGICLVAWGNRERVQDDTNG